MFKSIFQSLLLSQLLVAALFNFAFAADITWGKDKLLSVKVEYKGKTYQGELIGKMSEEVIKGEKMLNIERAGILVYGLRIFGLDQVVPLESRTDSPLCENFKWPYTAMWGSGNRVSHGNLVAKFIAPQVVELKESEGEWSSNRLSCMNRFADTNGD